VAILQPAINTARSYSDLGEVRGPWLSRRAHNSCVLRWLSK
jgi:hypothetical protein